MGILRLALWRSGTGRGLLLVVGLGVLVAATLLASAPIYARSMADLGLTYTIRQELAGGPGTRVQLRTALQLADAKALRAAVEQRIDERAGWFRSSQARHVRLGWFPMGTPGEAGRTGAPLGQPQSLSGYETHVRVVSGRLPQATGAGGPFEVAMSTRAAALAGGLRPGAQLDLLALFDNCQRDIPTELFPPPPPPCPITATATFTLAATLVGVIEPDDTADPFWVGGAGEYFDAKSVQIEKAGPVLPLFMDEHALLDELGARLPGYRATFAWNILAAPERLTRGNYMQARDELTGLLEDVQSVGGFGYSPLKDTLQAFGRSASYQQVPLTVLLLEITGIAVFYVAIVAAVVVERQADEIALLRGRGGSLPQVVALYVLQGLSVGLPALVAAPFLAAGMTALLGLTPAFDGVSGGELLPVTVVPEAFGLAALGVVFSLAALVVPAALIAFRQVMTVRRAESRPGRSFVQRYYLDLGLAAAAVLLLLELRERGSVFTPSSTGGVSSDPLLLAAPALAVAGAAALVLRFYPLVLRLIERGGRRALGAAAALSLAQAVRNPGQYTRLALLLMMAVAVGTFAASYSASAERSYEDRANYETGADLRALRDVNITRASPPPSDVERTIRGLEGVRDASAVVRTKAALGVPGQSLSDLQVLALEPAAGGLVRFRGDFAEGSVEDVLAPLGGFNASLIGRKLPGDPAQIGLWVRSAETLPALSFYVSVRDAQGATYTLPLGDLSGDVRNWTFLAGPVARPGPRPVAPLVLLGFSFSSAAFQRNIPAVFVDDASVVDANGTRTVIDDFEADPGWAAYPLRTSTPDSLALVKEGRPGGSGALRFAFSPEAASTNRGFYLASLLTPLPVVVSDSFVGATGTGPGGTTLLDLGSDILVPVRVAGTFHLFPTTSARDGPVVLMNRDQAMAWADLESRGIGQGLAVNEAWVTLRPGADEKRLESELLGPAFTFDHATSRKEALAEATSNPLVAASGSGILSLAFGAVLLLVLAAMLVSLATAVRRRRVELAVVRAIGLSRAELVRMLALEYAAVFLVGVGVGVALGLFVSGEMLSFLEVTEAGDRVEPGFVLVTRWPVLAAGVAALGVVFALALGVVGRAAARRSAAEVLRGD
ncbi:MAG: FtsX-like permease family protein [Dehalococcoidia bacterium]|nr:FtsX-like permease family protein [Dehalococcoidia bacterium]